MSESAAAGGAGPSWVPLAPRERRVLGVLVEKAKTTPEYYPLSVAAIVTGCNQKSNRDPVTNYDQDDVEDTLHSLRKKGAVILIEGGGRVARWKHTLYDWMKVSKVELAVMAELLLRGPQTEGELRARASRMEPLRGPACLAGDPRGPGAARIGAVPVAAGPETWRVRGARALSARRARARPPGVCQPALPATTRRRRGCRRPASIAAAAPGRAGLVHRNRRASRRGRPAARNRGRSVERASRPQVRTRSLTG